MDNKLKARIESFLEGTGVAINGSNPWDIQVHDERLYARVLAEGSLGFGEAYMDGWWDSQALDECLTRLLRQDLNVRIQPSWSLLKDGIVATLVNLQSKKRAFQIGERHYDVGNDLYQAMLDKRMTYTGGYWKDAANLDQAQEAKLDLVCRKIGLKPGQRVLDIGCGWGSFMKFAAEKYGAHCVGITVAKEQVKLGEELCKGLPIEFRLQDYREMNEPFDHIVSLGMIEHVGYKNYRDYFKVAHRCLKDGGLFLVQSIGSNESCRHSEAWIDKYIFPNSLLPSAAQLTAATDHLFIHEDWHNFHSSYYDKTLMAWYRNVEASWDKLKDKYDERFHRMWTYYLNACAGLFRSRQIQLWQIVYAKRGVMGGYTPER